MTLIELARLVHEMRDNQKSAFCSGIAERHVQKERARLELIVDEEIGRILMNVHPYLGDLPPGGAEEL